MISPPFSTDCEYSLFRVHGEERIFIFDSVEMSRAALRGEMAIKVLMEKHGWDKVRAINELRLSRLS